MRESDFERQRRELLTKDEVIERKVRAGGKGRRQSAKVRLRSTPANER